MGRHAEDGDRRRNRIAGRTVRARQFCDRPHTLRAPRMRTPPARPHGSCDIPTASEGTASGFLRRNTAPATAAPAIPDGDEADDLHAAAVGVTGSLMWVYSPPGIGGFGSWVDAHVQHSTGM